MWSRHPCLPSRGWKKELAESWTADLRYSECAFGIPSKRSEAAKIRQKNSNAWKKQNDDLVGLVPRSFAIEKSKDDKSVLTSAIAHRDS